MIKSSPALALCGLLSLAAAAPAQQTPAAPAAAQPAVPSGGALTAAELEELLGPIALYPDELLANVLAAAVYPDEVAQAAEFAKGARDAKALEGKDWEPPVKAIAKVPDVAKMMGEYMDWTTALGQAYLTQAKDVMAAVQSLRQKAQANGALKSTEQQKVVVEQETIYIQSADPEVIYVPSYEPAVVYIDDDDDDWVAGVVGFGAGIVVGAVWADLACDWHHGCVGWGGGWGDVDIDIDRNISTGDINIGNQVGSGNRVGNTNRVGREGGAWSPNQNKALATSKPSQAQNRRAGGAPGASTRASTPTRSSAGRAPPARSQAGAAGTRSRPAATPRSTSAARTAAPATPRQATAGASRVPKAPSTQRAQSAFSGGSGSRASSNRGSTSRQSASRSTGGGGRAAPSRSSGGGRSGGSRGGGGRGGGRR